jgi:16S rRNA processing protein RimM
LTAGSAGRLLEVGRITKPHGIKGEVQVDLVTDRRERVAPGSVLESDKGPLVVTSSRPHQGKWLVVFEGYADRTSAERLAGLVLRAEGIEDPEALWVDDLIGTEVVEVDGTRRGRVVTVLENPAHDILELDTGGLVPVVFVRSCVDGVTTVEVPEGLFDVE